MFYFIGGTSRTGKSTTAKKLADERNLQLVELDTIRNQLPNRPDVPDKIPEWFYPHLEKIAQEKNNTKLSCVFEGDCFYPEQMAKLAKQFFLKVCFLGSSTIDASLLRNTNGWHQYKNDVELVELATMIKDVSEKFKTKCLENNLYLS